MGISSIREGYSITSISLQVTTSTWLTKIPSEFSQRKSSTTPSTLWVPTGAFHTQSESYCRRRGMETTTDGRWWSNPGSWSLTNQCFHGSQCLTSGSRNHKSQGEELNSKLMAKGKYQGMLVIVMVDAGGSLHLTMDDDPQWLWSLSITFMEYCN